MQIRKDKKKQPQRSLVKKVLLGTFFAVLIPFLLGTAYLAYCNYRELIKEQVTMNQRFLDVGLNMLESYMGSLRKASRMVYNNPEIIEILEDKDSFDDQDRALLRTLMETMASQDSSIRQVTFSCNNGERLSEQTIRLDDNEDWKKAVYVDSDQSLSRGFVLEDGEQKLLAFKYSTTLQDYPDSSELMRVEFYCVTDRLEEISSVVNLNPDKERVAISLAQGDLFYADRDYDTKKIKSEGQGWSKGSLDGVQGFFFIQNRIVQGEEMTLEKFVPASEWIGPTRLLIMRLVIIELFIFLCVSVFLFYIYGGILMPIKKIALNMDRVRNHHYDYQRVYSHNDEIGLLESKYEAMVIKINQLINKDLRHALEITQMRLRILQAQVDPHFLNNTLQMISTQAIKSGDRKTADLLMKLGRMFAYTMDNRTDEVTLKEELTFVAYYLELQKGRFQSRLIYDIVWDETLARVKVPKMILQPLVENSVKHGFRKMNENVIGKIQVRISKKKMICMEVIDNGPGIEASYIEFLRHMYEDTQHTPDPQEGIGLLNVIRRLDIYAKDMEWGIESRPYEETIVRLCFMEREEVE